MRLAIPLMMLLLCGCTVSAALPGEIQQAAGAPTAICTSLLMQNAASLQQLKDALNH